MTDHDDVVAAVRAADPVDTGRLPTHDDAAPAALLREITMHDTSTSTTWLRSRWTIGAAAALAAIAGIGAVAATRGGDGESAAPATTAGPAVGPGTASCVEEYDLQTLANREIALDGTVASIDGAQITFAVERWFRGGSGDAVTLTSSTGGAVTPDAGPPLAVGSRLLVAGDGGFVWGCGFTQRYDDGVAADWAAVFID